MIHIALSKNYNNYHSQIKEFGSHVCPNTILKFLGAPEPDQIFFVDIESSGGFEEVFATSEKLTYFYR